MTKVACASTICVKERKFYLEVYGCQMNVYDGQIIDRILCEQSTFSQTCYIRTDSAFDAEVLLFNTCAIREKAFQKISNRVASLKYLQKQKRRPVFVLLGCLAQSLREKIWSLDLAVDLIVGPDNYRKLPELLEQLIQNQQKKERQHLILTKLWKNENYHDIKPVLKSHDVSAYVTIMRGCDNFCSFCVVPYTRGRERSRSVTEVIDEINYLIDTYNIQEVTLLGQNVNSYCTSEGDFTRLIEEILSKTSIRWLRFTSPHPKDFSLHLLELMAGEERFCSQIHLPLQSGSDRVLQRMNRNYTSLGYLQLVDQMREKITNLGLSTDIIVGFCGETKNDFEDTLQIVEKVKFDMAYMFYYSDRPHTLANRKFSDDVSEKIKKQRLARLIEVQQTINRDINQCFVEQIFTVLIEGDSKRSSKYWQGRSSCGKKIIFSKLHSKNSIISQKHKTYGQCRLAPGDFTKVKITASSSASFTGVLVGYHAT